MSASYLLYHGDCLDILPTLEAQSVDAVIADPPYGTTACKWDSVIPFEPMWRELKRLIKPRGAIVLFGSQPFTSALVMSNPKWFRYDWVWEKVNHSNFFLAKIEPLKTHESVLVFCEGSPTYNAQKGRAMSLFGKRSVSISDHHSKALDNGKSGVGYPKSIIRFPKPNNLSGGGLHPTQKPLALLEYLVKTYTNEGDTVLDFTMGSGTTGHACANTSRRFIGIEKDAGYFAIAQERIATAYEPLRNMQEAS